MSRVFVIQEQNDKNLLPAEKYGQLTVMLTQRDVDRGIEHCIEKMSDFLVLMREEDHLLLVGESLVMAVGFHIAVHFGEGRVSVLRWDRVNYRYNQEIVKI